MRRRAGFRVWRIFILGVLVEEDVDGEVVDLMVEEIFMGERVGGMDLLGVVLVD